MDTTRELFIACTNGNTQCVKELLELGTNPDVSFPLNFWSNGRTPLMVAAIWGRLEAAKVLIEYGADLDLTDRNGYTALMFSVYAKDDDEIETSYDMSKLLLTNGCGVDTVAQGDTFFNLLTDDVRIEMEEFVAGLNILKPAKKQ